MPSIKNQIRSVGIPAKVTVSKPKPVLITRSALACVALVALLTPIGGGLADTAWGHGPGIAAIDNALNNGENTREAYDALDQHLPDTIDPLEEGVAAEFTFWDPPEGFVLPSTSGDYSGASIDFDGPGVDLYGGIRVLTNIEYSSNSDDEAYTLVPDQCGSIPLYLNDGDTLRAVNTDQDVRGEDELIIKITDDNTLRICNGDNEEPASSSTFKAENLDNLYIEVVESSS